MGYIKKVVDQLYPEKNRVLAGVAASRTFKQSIKASVAVAAGSGAIAVTADQLSSFVTAAFLWGLLALLINALGAAAVAWDDVAQNGISSKYVDAVKQRLRAGEVSE